MGDNIELNKDGTVLTSKITKHRAVLDGKGWHVVGLPTQRRFDEARARTALTFAYQVRKQQETVAAISDRPWQAWLNTMSQVLGLRADVLVEWARSS